MYSVSGVDGLKLLFVRCAGSIRERLTAFPGLQRPYRLDILTLSLENPEVVKEGFAAIVGLSMQISQKYADENTIGERNRKKQGAYSRSGGSHFAPPPLSLYEPPGLFSPILLGSKLREL
jgi:hypothetical protein